MVTRRARRWMQRGVAAAVVAAVGILAAATWYTSEAIEAELLLMDPVEPQRTPVDVRIAFTHVDVPGPLGNYPAWLIQGTDDTWAVFVPDAGSSLAQSLDLLPTVAGSGLPALVTTLRNGFGAPPAAGGHHLLGDEEWEDVEAAVIFALAEGAQDVVLVGYGSGGATVLTFLRRSDWADRAVGVILDSPYLDPGAMVDRFTAEDNVPGFLSGWGRAMAAFRFGIDWRLLDQVAAAEEFETPMLLFQGDADRRTPVEGADRLAEARPDLVDYHRPAGVGHLGGFAADPDGYAARVAAFLDTVARGPTGLPEVDPEDVEPELPGGGVGSN